MDGHGAVNRTPSLTSQVEVELDDSSIEIPNEEDLGPIIQALKMGTLMMQFRRNSKLERVFHLNLEEFKISWARSGATGKEEEGSIHIEDIKEVQRGCTSKEFTSVVRRLESSDCCIVIVYGNTFRLKTLSCLAQSAKERDFWVKGLVFLKFRNQYVPPIALAHRWLMREWAMLPKNGDRRMSMREYKVFLQRANIKLTSRRMRETLNSVDKSDRCIDATQLCQVYNKLLLVKDVVEQYEEFFLKTEQGLRMTPTAFQRFLLEEQKDTKAHDIQYVYDIMTHVKPIDNEDATEYDLSNLFFVMTEFLSYLFHPMNSVFNDDHRVVYQDMTKPLSWYWISSSHNTYLTGDQIQSLSSEEAYTRVLRMGCRCVELDCWDGPNNEPIIYHGYTLTSKIKFVDVVKVIAGNAFAVTEYPLILSIENHCSVPQQDRMAEIFKHYLSNYLITEKLDPNETELPSPESLKRKIILKQKKLNNSTESNHAAAVSSRLSMVAEESGESIFSKSKKNGVVYMKDEYENWNKHLVVLWDNKLFYSDPQEEYADSDDEDDDKTGRQVI